MMRLLRRLLADWRLWAAVSATVLVALLAVLVVTSLRDRDRALTAAVSATSSEREARQAAVRRIDQLLAKIDALQRTGLGNSEQLALLRAEVVLLARQVRDLGGQPVVITGSDGSGSGQPSSAPSRSPRPSRSPSPHPTPSHTPAPSPTPSRTCVAVICVK